ncbi:HGGxSTG domain-containing protein [Rhizorhabdus argentea]|uniref:HGGxSTG domain-containing protein n=1 Tax=Rhizorhabdus argentea TaxID=1387174 RepID=UPI003BF537B4
MQPQILAKAPRCGARTRSGDPCRSPAVNGSRRCRMHGGKGSGAPRGNRNAWKHGIRSEWIRAVARYLRATRPAALPQLIERFVGPNEAGAPPRRSTASFGAPAGSAPGPMPRIAPRPGPGPTEKTKKRTDNPMHPGSGAKSVPVRDREAAGRPLPCPLSSRHRGRRACAGSPRFDPSSSRMRGSITSEPQEAREEAMHRETFAHLRPLPPARAEKKGRR